MEAWNACKNLLIVRLDNMGDVIMNNAALSELRDYFPESSLTLLTSSMAAPITSFLGSVDHVMLFDTPWMKLEDSDQRASLQQLIAAIKSQQFDACIIFSVYSQSSMPAALIAYLAEIPLRAGYSRENPYHLLTHWYPDPEPLFEIRHQIQRDLKLLEIIGIQPDMTRLPSLKKVGHTVPIVRNDLWADFVTAPYHLVHLEVSETKRQYPALQARELIQGLLAEGKKIVYTGQQQSPYLDSCIQGISDPNLLDLRGHTDIAQLLTLIEHATGVVCVNTSVMHIACAYERPLLALYADSNPQHTPWNQQHIQIIFDVPEQFRSKNQIITYTHFRHQMPITSPSDIPTLLYQYNSLF
ncbi:glycosyltransferase family 9 protein [Sphingobacterium paucimobilis]|uniref:Glycosyl transferase family 9 n=1 Tax=Sphingobacterium paucimobilis HER1398 TaxID=1346330 RepID=U2IX58_9SPHI|nr:glycosyltransferase family 9 protein [Sphingobacterium paucimobilis]ERJ57289.1 hypothetical protein M472_00775 [Sphingobacterium paucimobilis HER1398]